MDQKSSKPVYFFPVPTMGRMAMGSLNRPVLGRMGRLGFSHQYMTQIKVLMKKNFFWPKLADWQLFSHFCVFRQVYICSCVLILPIFEFLEHYTYT